MYTTDYPGAWGYTDVPVEEIPVFIVTEVDTGVMYAFDYVTDVNAFVEASDTEYYVDKLFVDEWVD